MAFDIVKAETRTARMVQWFAGIQSKITDFIRGGVMRTVFDALGVELEYQDYAFYQALRKAIPTAIYQAFGFNLLPASKATGVVTFTASVAPVADITIRQGTQVATVASSTVAEQVYEVSADTVLATGETTVAVPVTAVNPGTVGNTGSNSIAVLKTSVPSITSVNNAAALTNGADTESEPDRKTRFEGYIKALSQGTDAANIYMAKQAYLSDVSGNITERVVDAVVSGPPSTGSAGAFTLSIWNGSTGASGDLIARAQEMVDGYTDSNGVKVPGSKAAGIVATVAAVTTSSHAVTAELTATSDAPSDLQAQAATIIATYIQSLGIGDSLIYNELVQRLMEMRGVFNVDITAPSDDVTATASQVIVPGTITVTLA